MKSKDYGFLSDKQTQFVAEIFNANKRMTTLVNSPLNVSRLEMGTFSIEPALLDVVDLAMSNVGLFKSEILIKNIKLTESYDPKIKMFKADPKLLGIIFQNLLSNAVKYSPVNGKIELSIKQEGESLKITVADNGIGIPEYQQAKIFTKLFRADNVSKVDPSGTGLGLYIVNEVVSHSGGKVWFESVEGKGSTFFVSFPLSGMTKRRGTKKIT